LVMQPFIVQEQVGLMQSLSFRNKLVVQIYIWVW
jgi:hypothetical protein